MKLRTAKKLIPGDTLRLRGSVDEYARVFHGLDLEHSIITYFCAATGREEVGYCADMALTTETKFAIRERAGCDSCGRLRGHDSGCYIGRREAEALPPLDAELTLADQPALAVGDRVVIIGRLNDDSPAFEGRTGRTEASSSCIDANGSTSVDWRVDLDIGGWVWAPASSLHRVRRAEAAAPAPTDAEKLRTLVDGVPERKWPTLRQCRAAIRAACAVPLEPTPSKPGDPTYPLEQDQRMINAGIRRMLTAMLAQLGGDPAGGGAE